RVSPGPGAGRFDPLPNSVQIRGQIHGGRMPRRDGENKKHDLGKTHGTQSMHVAAKVVLSKRSDALNRISHHLIDWSTFRWSAAVREASAVARCERAVVGLRHSRAPIR